MEEVDYTNEGRKSEKGRRVNDVERLTRMSDYVPVWIPVQPAKAGNEERG
jgi:hypothetical protein